jgi:hypothetical protein
LRGSDLDQPLAFHTAVGGTVVGTVQGTAFGSLTMLRLPRDGFAVENTEPVDPLQALRSYSALRYGR